MSRWAKTLTTQVVAPKLDLLDYVGQRTATYRFDLVNIKTGYRRVVHPLRDSAPTLTHDTSRTIVRQLNNLVFTVPDSGFIDVITTRIEPFMVLEDVEYPLGRYIYNNETRAIFTAGEWSSGTLYDEGFIVDQKLTDSFSDRAVVSVGSGSATSARIQLVIAKLLSGLPIVTEIAPTAFYSSAGWPAGTSRGFIVEQLALDGDYLSPWFAHDHRMKFIRSFDPSTAVVTFDLDAGNKVLRERIYKTNDLIDAPNVFIVISNGIAAQQSEITGRYDVPSSAPHSVENRGFESPYVENRQVETAEQAKAVATNIGQRQTIFERIELYTPPDPRHDGYDVLRWQGENWLEIAWSLPLIEGAAMQHIARKAYAT